MSRTQLLTLIAFIGIAFGLWNIFYWSQSGRRRGFHEVAYDPGFVIRTLLDSGRIANRNGTLAIPGPEISMRDEAAVRGSLDTEMARRVYLVSALPDDNERKSYYQNGVLHVNKQQFRLRAFNQDVRLALLPSSTDTTVLVPWVYHLVPQPRGIHPPLLLEAEVEMPLKLHRSHSFFRQHPGFALWVLLLLLQYGMYPALLLLTLSLVRNMHKHVGQIYYNSAGWAPWWGRLGLSMMLATGITACAAWLAVSTFSRIRVVTPATFFSGLDAALSPLMIMGYGLAIVCFSGYLSIAGFNVRLRQKAATERLPAAGEAPPPEYETELKKIKRFHQMMNIIASLVLCLSVLCTGVMFSSINKLKFFNQLTNDLGYDIFPSDFVYLYGAIHSILLLIFFAPARINIVRLQTSLAEDGLIHEPEGASKGFNAWGIVKQLAIGASPLLTGVVQQLFEALSAG